MVAVEAGLLMFGGVASGDVPFAPECWLLQLGPSPLLGLRENEVGPTLLLVSAVLCPLCHSAGHETVSNERHPSPCL